MRYRVIVRPRPRIRLDSLPLDIQDIIVRRLERLANDPLPSDARPIAGVPQSYRLRLMHVTLYYRVYPSQEVLLVYRLSARQP